MLCNFNIVYQSTIPVGTYNGCNHVKQISFSTCQYQFVLTKRKTNIISYLHVVSIRSIYIMSHRTWTLEYRISNCFQISNNCVHNLTGKLYKSDTCVIVGNQRVSLWISNENLEVPENRYESTIVCRKLAQAVICPPQWTVKLSSVTIVL